MRGQKKIILFLLIVFLIAIACSKPTPPPIPSPREETSASIKELTFHIKKQLEERMGQINKTKLKAENFYRDYKKYNPEDIENLYRLWQEVFKKADARMETAKNLMNEVKNAIAENKDENFIASELRKIMLHINSKDTMEACCKIRDLIDELIK